MSAVAALCYACNETFMTVSGGDPESLRCRHCGSDFVELLTETEPRTSRNARRSPFQTRFVGDLHDHPAFVVSDPTVSIRLSPGGADDLMRELTHVFDLEPFGHANRLGAFRRNLGSEMERLVGQLAQYHQPTRTPASSEAVNGLRREKLRAGNGGVIGETCCVCHECYKEGDNVMHLPCEHVFHEGCVLPWFEEHNTCPVCRFALPVESPSTPSRTQRRFRRNQVVHESSRDVPSGDHMIDSFLGLFRTATGGDVPRRPRPRASLSDDVRHEADGERQLRESVRSAQNQLSSLEDRLTEHVAEHQRLQSQILQLQDHRQNLRDSFSSVHQGTNAVTRLDVNHQRRNSPSITRWLFGMIRNAPNRRSSHDFDTSSNFSDASGFGR